MRHRFAHALVFLACMITGATLAHAQAVDVSAEVLSPAVDAQPRQAVSLQIRFTNAGTAWRTIDSSLAVPAGWVVLVPAEEIRLAPGESRIALFTVLVAPEAAAGVYTFPLTYRTAAGAPAREALFTVRVPAIDQVELTLVDAPALVPAGEPHRVKFLLRNTGNTAHEWVLTASSSSSLPVDLTPGVATLGPGESATVVALVGAPERLARQQTHALTVTATSRTLPDVRATARATVLLVPTNLPAASALHTFPLTMSVSFRVDPLAAERANPRLAIEWSGSGTVGDGDPGRLDVRFRATPSNLVEHVAIEYQRPTWGVRFGHQDFVPSPLSSSVSGFGVSANATWALGVTDPFRAELAAYRVDGEARFAVAAAAALPYGTHLGATLSGGRADLLGTLGIRYAPERRDGSTLQLTLFETTYGLRVDGDVGVDQALRVAAQVNGGPSFARITYDTAAARFDGRDGHRAVFRATGALRLNDAFSVQARFPLNLTFGYDRTWAWDAGLAYGLVPPADAGGQEQRSMLGLSAGLGATTLNASYALTATNLAIYDAEHEVSAVVRSRITDDFTVSIASVWTRRQLLGELLSEGVELETGATLRIDDGLLTSSVALTHDLDAGRTTGLAFGVKWVGEPTPDLRWSLDTTLYLIDPARLWNAQLDLRYLLGDQRVLTTKVTGQVRTDRPFSLTFELGLAVPLRVPVGRRSDIGRLEGSITRSDGRGLPGAIVTVAGQAVTTTPDGGFLFPALPDGEHLVSVVTAGGLAANEYLTPDLPAAVLIADDATSELRFVVHEGATVAGVIATETVDPTTGRTSIAPTGSASDLARGVRIELRSDAATLHTISDASGAFRFQRVPAGAWTLQISMPASVADYRIDPSEVRLALEPGDHEEVAVRLVPIVRPIQFMDGGTLKSD